MADEMTVQGNKPSPLPYVVVGAGVGAGAVEGVKRWAPQATKYGVQTQKYGSWDDLVKDVGKDVTEFTNKFEHGNDETRKTIDGLKDTIKPLTEANKEFSTALDDAVKMAEGKTVPMAEFKEAVAKQKALLEAQETGVKNLKENIKKISGFEKIEDKDIDKKVKELIADKTEEGKNKIKEYYNVTEAENAANNALEALKTKDGVQSVDLEKVLKAHKTQAEKVTSVKSELEKLGNDGLNKIKGFSKWNYAIAAVALAALGLLIAPKGNKEQV